MLIDFCLAAAWDALERLAVDEGLIGVGYEREKYGKFARVYQFAKLYLYAGACSVADCPLVRNQFCFFIIMYFYFMLVKNRFMKGFCLLTLKNLAHSLSFSNQRSMSTFVS